MIRSKWVFFGTREFQVTILTQFFLKFKDVMYITISLASETHVNIRTAILYAHTTNISNPHICQTHVLFQMLATARDFQKIYSKV